MSAEILLADSDEVLATLGERLDATWVKVWMAEDNRYARARASSEALRMLDPSRWIDPYGQKFVVRLCPPERLAGVLEVPFGRLSLPVLPLWELVLADPAVGGVFARTREILATRPDSAAERWQGGTAAPRVHAR